MFRIFANCCLSIALLGSSLTLGADWPAFRGPENLGTGAATDLPVEWSADKNVAWKVNLPGPGNGSPIFADSKVFVTSAHDEGAMRTLLCFDAESGDELWSREVEAPAGEETHKTNPYAGTTPAYADGLVVVWHGTPGLFCYDAAGEQKWQADLGRVEHYWGYGSSPVIHEGRVFLNFGPGVNTAMVAVDLASGEELWRTPEPGGANSGEGGRNIGSWSTPIVTRVAGDEQLLCSMPTRVVSYDPATGEILWTISGLPSSRGDLVYSSLMIAGDVGIAMGGYKGPALGFRIGKESGDVTESSRLWYEEQRQPQRIGSGAIVDGYLYIANAGPGTFECIDIKTGETVWRERASGDHWGSVCYVDGKLYVTNQDGATTVFAPNPEKYEELAVNELGETSNATPAFSDGRIFIRTAESLFCIGE